MIMIFLIDLASIMAIDHSDWTRSEMNLWRMMKTLKQEVLKDNSKSLNSIKEILSRALEEVSKSIKMEDLKNKDDIFNLLLKTHSFYQIFIFKFDININFIKLKALKILNSKMFLKIYF